MKVGIWTPAYRYQVTVQHRDSVIADVVWAMSHGHEPSIWSASSVCLPRMRNQAIARAIDMGLDRLMMVDADVWGDGVLGRLWAVMDEMGCALAGLAVPCRDPRQGVVANCDPWTPGEVYEGQVGTGAVLIDVHQVAEVSPPWCVDVMSPDGCTRLVGHDIYLSRLLLDEGKSVMVDAREPMGRHLRPVEL